MQYSNMAHEGGVEKKTHHHNQLFHHDKVEEKVVIVPEEEMPSKEHKSKLHLDGLFHHEKNDQVKKEEAHVMVGVMEDKGHLHNISLNGLFHHHAKEADEKTTPIVVQEEKEHRHHHLGIFHHNKETVVVEKNNDDKEKHHHGFFHHNKVESDDNKEKIEKPISFHGLFHHHDHDDKNDGLDHSMVLKEEKHQYLHGLFHHQSAKPVVVDEEKNEAHGIHLHDVFHPNKEETKVTAVEEKKNEFEHGVQLHDLFHHHKDTGVVVAEEDVEKESNLMNGLHLHELFHHNSNSNKEEMKNGEDGDQEQQGGGIGQFLKDKSDEVHQHEINRHKRIEHIAEATSISAAALALYEEHEMRKDPEHAMKHKVAKMIAGALSGEAEGVSVLESHVSDQAKEDEESPQQSILPIPLNHLQNSSSLSLRLVRLFGCFFDLVACFKTRDE